MPAIEGENTTNACEWALAAGLPSLMEAAAAGVLVPAPRGWTAPAVAGAPVTFTRLYAGAEFCRHRLPSPARWADLLAVADARRAPVTLLTPPATEDDLSRVAELLKHLTGRPGAEVVANDWGVLRLVRRAFPAVRPILGRCLRRQKKDPRIHDLGWPSELSDGLQGLLAHLGVELLEADWLPDGPSPLPLSVHLPYAFFASGSLCALSGLGQPPERKFLPDQPCPEPCRSLSVHLYHPSCASPMRLVGNTFFRPNGLGAAAGLRPDVVRLVYDLEVDVERAFLGGTGSEGEP